MQHTTKKPYRKPEIQAHGSVSEVTQFFHFFGGSEGFLKPCKPTRGRGPADFGS